MSRTRPRTRTRRWSAVAVVLLASLLGAAPAGAEGPPAPRPDPRIVGGTPTAPGTWRSMAAVLDAHEPDPAAAQRCGATVIDPTWVVTAAHCVTDWDTLSVQPAHLFDVLVGTHNLRRGGRRLPVSEVLVRDDWDPELLRNDVALLHLAAPARVPIDVTVAGRADVPWSGAPLRTAGWGVSDDGWSTHLREVQVPARSPEECKTDLDAASRELGTPPYDPSHLCTGPIGSGGQGPCHGDSGGPLVWDRDGRRVLVGVTSWGAYCASPETPSVFTRVATSSAWIPSSIRFGPHPDGPTFAYALLLDYVQPELMGELAVPLPDPGEPGAAIARVQARPSVQRRDATVARLYHAVLGRAPEPWGYEYWRYRMALDGVGATRVADVMARSAEFRATYGSLDDHAFVAQVFANVLGRPGAAADVAYFTGRLARGESRGRVVALVAESPENRARTQARVDVEVAFLALAGRAPRPDELATWTGRTVAELGRFLVHSGAYADRWAGFALDEG